MQAVLVVYSSTCQGLSIVVENNVVWTLEQISSCLVIAEPEGSKKRLVAPTTKKTSISLKVEGKTFVFWWNANKQLVVFAENKKRANITLWGPDRIWESSLFLAENFAVGPIYNNLYPNIMWSVCTTIPPIQTTGNNLKLWANLFIIRRRGLWFTLHKAPNSKSSSLQITAPILSFISG